MGAPDSFTSIRMSNFGAEAKCSSFKQATVDIDAGLAKQCKVLAKVPDNPARVRWINLLDLIGAIGLFPHIKIQLEREA